MIKTKYSLPLFCSPATNSGSTEQTKMNANKIPIKWNADDTLQLKEYGGLNDFQADTSVHQYESVQ